MKMHASITAERLEELMIEDDNLCICLACGADADCVEPDAREYKCDECGEHKVYGVQEIILMVV